MRIRAYQGGLLVPGEGAIFYGLKRCPSTAIGLPRHIMSQGASEFVQVDKNEEAGAQVCEMTESAHHRSCYSAFSDSSSFKF